MAGGNMGQQLNGGTLGLNSTPTGDDPVTSDCRYLAPISGTHNRPVIVSVVFDPGEGFTAVELQGSNDNGETWAVVVDTAGSPSVVDGTTEGVTYVILGAHYDFLRVETTGGGASASATALVVV